MKTYWYIACLLPMALLALGGCGQSQSSGPGLGGDPAKAREDMVKWHKEHDKVPKVVQTGQ